MKQECEAVFLFIAELTGSFIPGSGTVEDKIACGKNNYINGFTKELDLTKEEDRKDLHENIWLERLYSELDHYFMINSTSTARGLALYCERYRTETYQWSVPIELDASASLMQYIGLLLNDRRLMEMTNIIGKTLQDPWKLEGLDRAMLKKAATPMMYGSSRTCTDLWSDANIKYTFEDVMLYNKEMSEGPYGLINMFKDFIINSCTPKVNMKVVIGESEFEISCNRYRTKGEKLQAFKIWDSVDKRYNTILHTKTEKVPDLEQFRLYFVTLLI